MPKQFLECGKIVTTHGVRGEVKVQPWCDGPEFLRQFTTFYLDAAGGRPVRVQSVRGGRRYGHRQAGGPRHAGGRRRNTGDRFSTSAERTPTWPQGTILSRT